jgi:RNA polymerase sigma-70 factor (ECF subfamily)
MDDARLVEGVLRGEVPFDAVTQRFGPRMYRRAYRLLGNRRDAIDACQCAFIRAWERRNRYDPAKGEFGAWLYRIVSNVAYSMLRQRKREPVSLDALPESEQPSCEGPAKAVERKLCCEALWRAVSGLPPLERQVMVGLYKDGKHQREVAAEVHRSEREVRNIRDRAVAHLRMVLL